MRGKNREFDNRPLNTGSSTNSELANQPTLSALFTLQGDQMEQSYEARGENLGRRKKPKFSNYSGKFLSLPCEIVALRFLRICSVATQPFRLPVRRDKRNLDPPFSPSHGSFLKMILVYAIVSRDVLLKHLRHRSFLDLQ